MIEPFSPERITKPRRVVDALSSVEVITPMGDLNKSNAERRTRMCLIALEKLKRNILNADESSSSLKLNDYFEFMGSVKQNIHSTRDRYNYRS